MHNCRVFSKVECNAQITGETRGTVSSPGYPGRYPHNADCTWTISVAVISTLL